MATQKDIQRSARESVGAPGKTGPGGDHLRGGAAVRGETLAEPKVRAGPAGGFLDSVLREQSSLGPTHGGAVLAAAGKTRTRILAVVPAVTRQGAPLWLKQAAELFHQSLPSDGVVVPVRISDGKSDGRPEQRLFLYPIGWAGGSPAAVAVVMSDGDPAVLQARRAQLANAAGRLTQPAPPGPGDKAAQAFNRLRAALETASAVTVHDRCRSAALAFCNELASRWGCDRASIGFLKGRQIRLEAMSHAERFDRKQRVVHDLEAVMEECLDQDCEIVTPAPLQAEYVCRESAEFSKRYGPLVVLSLPLRRKGQVHGATTLERPHARPFVSEEVEILRLACDLCTPWLLELRRHDRWFGAKLAGEMGKICAAAVGAQHTLSKMLAVLAFCALAFLVFARGQYRVEASFVLDPEQRQVVCAPFDGFIESSGLEVGDVVTAGETVLAGMDTTELVLRKAQAQAERETYAKQVSAAVRDGKVADAQIARAQIAKIDAQIELADYYLNRARITAPLSGTIVNGDLKRQIGAPVKTGDVLFELTPLVSLRAELLVPEEEVPQIVIGQHGRLATISYPDRKIEFVVEQIDPIAQVVNQKNVFRVRCRLVETESWMRPGMEGVAKVSIGKRPYCWIWTRKIVRWLRMKLWI